MSLIRAKSFRAEYRTCRLCGKEYILSRVLEVCPDCIREKFHEARRYVYEAHRISRESFALPYPAPRSEDGVFCGLCPRNCRLRPGEVGYCGLVFCDSTGKLRRKSGSPEWGVLDWYYDPLPTNCVAGWFCPASTGKGYPKYAVKPEAEVGYYNLAVFYGSCNLDCLYCQNWQYRRYHLVAHARRVHVNELVSAVNDKVTCVCYFGGDPSTQIVHSLIASVKMLEKARRENRILRICWETNGQVKPHFLKKMIDLALKSGGIIKVDIKAGTPQVYNALTDGDYEIVLNTVKEVAKRFKERKEVPLLNISLLVVPGYIDEVEIERTCRLVNELNPEIPVSFLAFHPDYLMVDLPPTSKKHMDTAIKIAREYGLAAYNVGNEWLLGDWY